MSQDAQADSGEQATENPVVVSTALPAKSFYMIKKKTHALHFVLRSYYIGINNKFIQYSNLQICFTKAQRN